MDLQMPVMSGLDATGQIRKLEEGSEKRIPIIAMTARAMPEDREVCLSAGMDEYVPKPIKSQRLQELISELFAFDSGR